jgi:hypothetical protein
MIWRICMILFSVNGRYCILVQFLIAYDKRSTDHSRSVSVYVRLSACIHPPPPPLHWTDFREIWYWRFSRKYVEELFNFFAREKNIGHFIWWPECVSCFWQRQYIEREHCCASLITFSVCINIVAGDILHQQYKLRIVAFLLRHQCPEHMPRIHCSL